MSHPRWIVCLDGTAIPPRAIKRMIQFSSQTEALNFISSAPRICCTEHKLDDAQEFLREYSRIRSNPWVPVYLYAAATGLSRSEASHTLSRLMREGRAYRSSQGKYRWRNSTGRAMEVVS